MIQISESLVKEHLICPKRTFYRISYPAEVIQSNDMSIGSAVHAVLEKAWRNSKEATHELEIQLKKFNVKTNEQLAYKCIANFFTSYRSLINDSDIIEKFFTIPISKEVVLVGKMDRISNNGMILDWKTGKSEPEAIERDVQCLFYFMAYKKMYKKEPSDIFLVFLAKNKVIRFEPNEILIKEFETQVLPKVIYEVKNKIFPRNGLFVFRGCERCPYQNICYTELEILE
jgi:CRISPR/Cas system-associated exonuclease Cas4 (RecB family)